ncbi:MAG: lysozyme inhibitor LprI family protein [Gemmatimonadaceae bacterium]|nr:lysozyme inhibitor LprI family protein [Gemmatimonadaceae bacterium]
MLTAPVRAQGRVPMVDSASTERCAPAGSAMCVGIELVATRDSLDRLLARHHARLVPLLDSAFATDEQWRWRLRGAVTGLDSAWRAWRAKDCELAGAMTGAGGSWPSTWAVSCEVTETRRRVTVVRAAERCLRTAVRARDPDAGADACLTRLRLLRASPP